MKLTAQTILAAPIAQWPARVQSTQADLAQVERDLDELIRRSTLLRTFIRTRCHDVKAFGI